MSGRAYIWIQS